MTWSDGTSNGGTSIINYRISRSVSGGSYSVIAVGVTSKSYTVTGLTIGTQYAFIVEAQNSVGFSSVSSSLSFTHVNN